jgi:hypothetical protein
VDKDLRTDFARGATSFGRPRHVLYVDTRITRSLSSMSMRPRLAIGMLAEARNWSVNLQQERLR